MRVYSFDVKKYPEAKPIIGRVVTTTHCRALKPKRARKLLAALFTENWPENTRLKFLITPGGFVEAKFPADWSGKSGWKSRPEDFNKLLPYAKKILDKILNADETKILKLAKGKADILTICIDLHQKGGDKFRGNGQHVELVAIVDVNSDAEPVFTGKSYPTRAQANKLIHETELDSHFQNLAGETVLVLGCHDLNMFSHRSHASLKEESERWKRSTAMRSLMAKYEPTVILHHAHSTDSPNIWSTAWGSLKSDVDDKIAWASSIGYFHWDRDEKIREANIDKVLEKTCDNTRTIDFICKVKK